jgi:hypothetical protein
VAGTVILFFILGLAASLVVGWVVFPKLLYSQKHQPVSFDHALHMEQVRLADLARKYGTPLFVYSQTAILDALAAYQRRHAERDEHDHSRRLAARLRGGRCHGARANGVARALVPQCGLAPLGLNPRDLLKLSPDLAQLLRCSARHKAIGKPLNARAAARGHDV